MDIYLLRVWTGPGRLLLDEAGAAGELGQTEDHKLRWFNGRHTDLAHDLPEVDTFGRVGLVVTFDVKSVTRRRPRTRRPCAIP